MIPSTIFSLVKRYTGVDENQYSQTDFLLDLNIVKDDLWNKIVATKLGKMNYEIWTASMVANQGEYRFPTVSSTAAGAKSVKRISLNYDGATHTDLGTLIYTPATEVNPFTLPNEWSFYQENQSEDYPIYYEADGGYFIAPTPRTAQANGILIEGIRKIPDYNINTTEAGLKIPVDYQMLLVWGVIPYALMSKKVDSTQIIKAQQDYARLVAEGLDTMSEMVEGPTKMRFPGEVEEIDTL